MTTIRDVAQLAGVSTATVSHVLNDTRVVSDDLRGRVVAAMVTLNYRPNAVARSLRVSETLTIGLIVPDVELPFFARYARDIEVAASEVGYNVILCNSNWALANELRYLDHLLARRVDGLICISVSMTPEHIAPILRRNAPVVWLEESRIGHDADAIILDNQRGAYDAAWHLIERGHQRIGCITGPTVAQLTGDRISGFRQALRDAGLIHDERLTRVGAYDAESGYRLAGELLDLGEPPTALFAFNDIMAIGALRAAHERGLRAGQHIGIIGFDGIGLTAHASPPLSTIEQPTRAMSEAAIALLLERVNGQHRGESRTLRFQARLVARESTLGA